MSGAPGARTLREWFDEVVEADAAERARLIETLRASDAALAEKLERLLAQHEKHLHSVTRSAAGALANDAALRAPPVEQAGPWRLHEELGRGGMGRVFRAERVHGDLHQEVALKLLRRDLLDDRLLQRFSTERQVLAALEHPGICRLIDAGELPDGTPYVAMELVRGQGLIEYCDAQRLGLRARLELFLGVLDAVAHAHRNLVVHRDIKPGNVMVDREGRTKLLDFGIAKQLDPDAVRHTLTTDRVYTLAYAAPEQIRGGSIGVACDVYSLGALLYELLSGVAPFSAGRLSPGEFERRILETPPPRMSDTVDAQDGARAAARGLRARDLRRALNGDLDLIVQRCLRKAAEERYTGVDALQLDLRRYLDGHPISGRLDERWYRLRKFAGRHRVAVGIGTVSVATLLAALALIVQQAFALREERDRVVLERDRATEAVDFMRDAFIASDPARAAGVDVRARDILKGADERLAQVKESQPELFASLATTIGEVYAGLGDRQRALELAEAALLVHRQGGRPTPLPLFVLHAKALTKLNRFAEAETALRAAESAGYGEEVEIRTLRASLLTEQRKKREAIDALRLLKQEVASRPPTDMVADDVRRMLAEAYRFAGEFDLALAEFDDVLAWQRAGLPPSHVNIQLSRISRSTVLRRLGRTADALSEAQDVRTVVEHAYAAQGSMYANVLMALATAQSAAGHADEALETTRLSVAAWERALGPDHRATLRTRYNLAGLLLTRPESQGEGARMLEAAFDAGLRRYGASNDLVEFLRLVVARQRLSEGKPLAALKMLVGPDAEAGLLVADEGNRAGHLYLAQDAAERLGCVGSTEPAVVAACEAFRALEQIFQRITSNTQEPAPNAVQQTQPK